MGSCIYGLIVATTPAQGVEGLSKGGGCHGGQRMEGRKAGKYCRSMAVVVMEGLDGGEGGGPLRLEVLLVRYVKSA